MMRMSQSSAALEGRPMSLRIFCDFDGPIAVKDVGNELFTRYSDRDHWWRRTVG